MPCSGFSGTNCCSVDPARHHGETFLLFSSPRRLYAFLQLRRATTRHSSPAIRGHATSKTLTPFRSQRFIIIRLDAILTCRCKAETASKDALGI